MAVRPTAVAFDVVETLMSLQPLAARFEEVGLPASALPAWFARLLLYGVGLSAAGDYVSFPAAAAEALGATSGYRLSAEEVDHVLAGFAHLPAHPDAEVAMARLAEGGVRMMCLTNGAAETTSAFLRRSGLDRYIEAVASTAEVHSWKPPARVYHHALDVLGLPAHQVALVAVHAWDCHGAKRAGLTTGWAARLEGRYGALFAPPRRHRRRSGRGGPGPGGPAPRGMRVRPVETGVHRTVKPAVASPDPTAIPWVSGGTTAAVGSSVVVIGGHFLVGR